LLLGGGHGGARKTKNLRRKREQKADAKVRKDATVVGTEAK
jgi:hypothetical protein